MPKVLRLEALHCGMGTSDKVYVVALVDAPPGSLQTRLLTYNGRRRQTLVERQLQFRFPSDAAVKLAALVKEKQRKGYKRIDWTDPFYGLANLILTLDPGWGDATTANPATMAPVLPSKPGSPIVPPPAPQPAPPGRSARQSRELDI